MTTETPSTPASALAKTFDPAGIEARWYAHWEAGGLFRPARPDAEPFTIVNPPPNVTGSLHIGHALDNTLQDVVVRYERLRGKDALWVVGTDHAGIATQMVVERQLEAQQDKRTNYTRDEFIAKVWAWKHESGGTITGQLRRLGCSMDWSREQFTMDPHFSKAVTKVFVDLYNGGLIYRDKRLVNWDPKLKTAISDLEVETQELKGKFWHFRYPLADGVRLADGSDHLVVATTRPETMLADMAVAVNAKDARYQSVIGKFVELPITGRRVPIVADDHADPELGSGAVKITPGHDFNDFEVGKRAGFKAGEMLNMFDAEANVVQTSDGLVLEKFIGLHRFRKDGTDGAREAVVAEMKALGRLVLHTDKDGAEHEAEDRVIATPFGDRGGVVVEPWLTDQWYVDAKTLAQPPLEAVRDGRIEIVPKSWEKTFFNWMENIQPWCVSRQLWWGHRIPAWYGPVEGPIGSLVFADSQHKILPSKPQVFVAETESEATALATKHYRDDLREDFKYVRAFNSKEQAIAASLDDADLLPIYQDQDVLDTWFSSALWPFATLGWPNPPRNGEGDHAQHGGGVLASQSNLAPGGTDPSTTFGGPPPRAGEDLLARHYPNDLLISGFDILFFWDARMAMMGMKLNADENGRGVPPWKRLYLHGLVRAGDGQKMSKSKGNVVDPLVLIDRFGADALRFFMAAMESQGRDIKIDEKRVEGYRNFATKLWNAARFCQGNGIAASSTLAAPAANSAVNRWIIGEVVETVAALDSAMADLRFDAAANTIYHFVWDTFCDWYLELVKPVLSPQPNPARPEPVEGLSFSSPPAPSLEEKSSASTSSARAELEETKAVAGWVLDQILVMLHPFMPFVTEELWNAMGARDCELIIAEWPEPGSEVDAEAKREVEWLIELVSKVRAARNELNVPPGARVPFAVETDEATEQRLTRHAEAISRLARIQRGIVIGGEAQVTADNSTYVLQLSEFIDIAAEKTRLTKALEASTKEVKALAGRLSNPAFVEKAKPEAVDKARSDHAHHAAEAERLAAALARLG